MVDIFSGGCYASSQLIKRDYQVGDILAQRNLGKKHWYMKYHSAVQNTVSGYPLGHGATAHMMIVVGFDIDNHPIVSHLTHPDFKYKKHFYKGSPLTLGLPITQRLPEAYTRSAFMVIRAKSLKFAEKIAQTAKDTVKESYEKEVKFTVRAIFRAGYRAHKKNIKMPLSKERAAIPMEMICSQFIAVVMARTCHQNQLSYSKVFNVNPAMAIGRVIEDTVKKEHMSVYNILITTPDDKFSCYMIGPWIKSFIKHHSQAKHLYEAIKALFELFESQSNKAYEFNFARTLLFILKQTLPPKVWQVIEHYLSEGTQERNYENGFGLYLEDIEGIHFSSNNEINAIESCFKAVTALLETQESGHEFAFSLIKLKQVIEQSKNKILMCEPNLLSGMGGGDAPNPFRKVESLNLEKTEAKMLSLWEFFLQRCRKYLLKL